MKHPDLAAIPDFAGELVIHAEPLIFIVVPAFERSRAPKPGESQDRSNVSICIPLVVLHGESQPVALQSGETVVADEGYIRESILEPRAKLVHGYKPLMPTYEGQISEVGILELVEYVKSISGK